MTIDINDRRTRRALQDMLEEIEFLSTDLEPEVREALQAATKIEMPSEEAEAFCTRILRIIREATDGGVDDAEILAEVRRVLARAQGAPEGADDEDGWGVVDLVARHGLTPHQVTPTPSFNDVHVPMWEGYVDVDKVDLWKGNHRVELQVAEFKDRHHREPEDDELLQLMFGDLVLPSLNAKSKDPFKISTLAKSVARKGVERPPILSGKNGEPKDGNRRLAAAKYVRTKPGFTLAEKERARWVKVWVAPPKTTLEQFDAIVVALNFEDDLKEQWPEFVKARLVVGDYRTARGGFTGAFSAAQDRQLKKEIADKYAISASAVTRYLRMVQWAEDFETYHVDERGIDPAEVRYKADDIFQWFYEIQAGKSADKITNQMDEDESLRKIVYDLMFEVMDSGAQVRSLWKVVADKTAMSQLENAHDRLEADDRAGALELVKEAVTTADRNTATRKKIGFESFLTSCVDRLGAAPPDNWNDLDSTLLGDLERVFVASLGAIEAQLVARGERPVTPRG